MKFVVIEIPRKTPNIPMNRTTGSLSLFWKACILDAHIRNEIPVFPGIEGMSNNLIRRLVDTTVVYRDLGYDRDMLDGIDHAHGLMKEGNNHSVEYRELGEAWTQVTMFERAVDTW